MKATTEKRKSAEALPNLGPAPIRLLAVVMALAGLALGDATQRSLSAEATSQAGQGAVLSQGGRLYDNHWTAVGSPSPNARHPLYPANAKQAPYATWRSFPAMDGITEARTGILASCLLASLIFPVWQEPTHQKSCNF